jgi:hypothetical protein
MYPHHRRVAAALRVGMVFKAPVSVPALAHVTLGDGVLSASHPVNAVVNAALGTYPSLVLPGGGGEGGREGGGEERRGKTSGGLPG